MSWVKLDDRIFDNPKIAALSDTAKVAYLEATCYCARELTDGFVPLNKAKGFAGKPKVVQELVPHLWETAPGGFRVHDYLKYNPTRVKVLAEREAAQRRMFGLRSAEQPANNPRSSDAPVNPVSPSSSSPEHPEPEPTPQNARAATKARKTVEFHPTTEPPWPDDTEDGISFESQYVLAYRKRENRDHPGASVTAECRRLERDFGLEACVQIASDHNWEKHPNWYRTKLEDRAKNEPVASGPRIKSYRYDD